MMDREEFFRRYDAGERNFMGYSGSIGSCLGNLNGINLQNAILLNNSLDQSFLINANLSHVNFEGSDLVGCFFNNSNFRNANLRNCDLTGADLTGADLTGADLTGADLTGAFLLDTNLTGANITNVKTSGTIFHETIMPDGRISHKSSHVLDGKELLKRCRKGETYFSSFILYKANLNQTSLSSITLPWRCIRVNFRRVSFVNIDIIANNFVLCDFRKANFSRANLWNGNFACCDFREIIGSEQIRGSDSDAFIFIDCTK